MNSFTPLDSEPKVSSWKQLVAAAGCTIKKITPVSLLHRKNGELLFALLDCDIRSPEGTRLPNYIFIRGDACLIVTLIRNRDTGEERFLMIRQRRTGNGSLSLEFPAGMLDRQVNNPLGVAAREVSEETGLMVKESDLFPLCGQKLFSSAGASDEAIFYFGCIKEIDGGLWKSLIGRKTGNPEEGEHISVVLMSRKDAEMEATAVQVRLGFYLFEEYLKRNMKQY